MAFSSATSFSDSAHSRLPGETLPSQLLRTRLLDPPARAAFLFLFLTETVEWRLESKHVHQALTCIEIDEALN